MKNIIVLTTIILFVVSFRLDKERASMAKVENIPVIDFEGKIMFSNDNGKSWNKERQSLPDYVSFQAVGFDKENVIIAINKDSIFIINKGLSDGWKQISVDELLINGSKNKNSIVGSIWSGKKNNYIEFIFGQLLKKEVGSSRWIPVSKPKDVTGIVQLAEDEQGNVYAATGYGLYISQDGCIHWTHILNGRVDDVEILNGEIFVSSLRGILSSKDFGKNWTYHVTPQVGFTLSKQEITPFYSLSAHDDELIAIKNEGNKNDINDAKVITFSGTNNIWKIHESSRQLKALKNLTGFAKANNKLYCSYGGGLMVSENNGVTWNKILNYTPSSENKAIKVTVVDGILYCYEISAGC